METVSFLGVGTECLDIEDTSLCFLWSAKCRLRQLQLVLKIMYLLYQSGVNRSILTSSSSARGYAP
jgi:hypothetical protein